MKHQAGRNPTRGDAARPFLTTAVGAPCSWRHAPAPVSGTRGTWPSGCATGPSTRAVNARRSSSTTGTPRKLREMSGTGSAGIRRETKRRSGSTWTRSGNPPNPPAERTFPRLHRPRRGEEGAKVEAAGDRWLPIRSPSARSPCARMGLGCAPVRGRLRLLPHTGPGPEPLRIGEPLSEQPIEPGAQPAPDPV